MRGAKPIAGWLTAALTGLALTACGRGDDSVVNVIAIGGKGDIHVQGARMPLAGQLLRASTAEGLVAFDAEGRVVPALADRWIVTDDGRSYIFRLRDGDWRDGTPLTGKAARAALDKAIAALNGSALGIDLAAIDDIRDMAGRVIEIRLARPMPDLLQLLAQPELSLIHEKSGAGPMQLAMEKDSAVLTPIDPERLGLPAVPRFDERARVIRLRAMPGEAAVSRFNAGEADVLLGGGIEDFPLASSVGIMRGTIQLDPVSGLFGLAVTNAEGCLEKPENREAIAMAIDREGLIAPFGVGGWTASTRIVAGGLPGDIGTIGERWASLDIAERRELAKTRVAHWRAGHASAPRLRIAMPQGPGAGILFANLSRDLAAIGLAAQRVKADAPSDLRLIDDIARYPQPEWFINRFNCKVQRGLCSSAADARAAEARVAADPASRAALLAEAEAELTVANVYIPFGVPIRWSLVRSDAIGFAPNRWGWHPLMPMALRPK